MPAPAKKAIYCGFLRRKRMQKAWEFARGDAAFEDKVVID